jgi:hypothetical protein
MELGNDNLDDLLNEFIKNTNGNGQHKNEDEEISEASEKLSKELLDAVEKAYEEMISDPDFFKEMDREDFERFLSMGTIEENEDLIKEKLIPMELYTHYEWCQEYIEKQKKKD